MTNKTLENLFQYHAKYREEYRAKNPIKSFKRKPKYQEARQA